MEKIKYHILVVDDEQDIRESLRDILEDEGHKIFLAENAMEARNWYGFSGKCLV